MIEKFQINAQLAADTVLIKVLPLCDLRLMREMRWFWLILVPRLIDAEEVFDLSLAEQGQLMAEISSTARLLQQVSGCDKINIGALGNIVRQLHIHIVARHKNDACWPAPVWGNGGNQEPNAAQTEERQQILSAAIKSKKYP